MPPDATDAASARGRAPAEVRRRRDPARPHHRRPGALASTYNAIAILKGAGSVIARPDGQYAINPTGSPALATAGTGDVLAGLLGALLAQDYAPWDAAVAATWLHGRAGEDAGDIGLVASDVAARAADELRRLRAGLNR